MSLRERVGRGHSSVDALVARMRPRQIPLASFFPCLGCKHGVIFLGFVKNPPEEEIIVSMDKTTLSFHQFCPFRTESIVGCEVLRLLHLPEDSEGVVHNMLLSDVVVCITHSIVVSIVCYRESGGKTVVRVFKDGSIVYFGINDSFTVDHSLYRADYFDQSSPFLFTYRTYRCSISILTSLGANSDNQKGTFSTEGVSWLKNDYTPGRHQNGVQSATFNGLEFARDFVAKTEPLYTMYELQRAVAVCGPPSADLLRIPIIIYIPLESTHGSSEKRRKHKIVILSLFLCSCTYSVDATLDAEIILSGQSKIEFAGYCTARSLKISPPCVAYFCREKICEDDAVHLGKETYSSVLSNVALAKNHSESWYAEISHPTLPLVVFNDELDEMYNELGMLA